jgi:hypothetical protein
MKTITTFFLLTALFIANIDAFAKTDWVNQIPNGSKNKCLTCHNSQSGGSTNPFGKTVKNGYVDSKGKVVWGMNLASIDSDADGFTNGVELQDADGVWKSGTTNPGDIGNVTNPGDKNSFPTSSFVYNADELPFFADISKFEVYPNPVSNSSHLSVTIRDNATLDIEIYNADGSYVTTLYKGFSAPGNIIFSLNPRDYNLSNGMYIIRATSGRTTVIRKFSVLR